MTETNKPPAFQFYARDWLAGKRNRMLRPAERGAYIDLLAVNWTDGAIPTCVENLADLLRGLGYDPDELRLDRLLALFPKGKSTRLEAERAKQAEYRRKKADAGRKGARKRWHDDDTPNGSAIAHPIANDSSSSASASAGSSVLSEPGGPDVDNSLADGLEWNARLAPIARELGSERNVGNWLKKAKHNPEYYERVMQGLVSMRDRGALDFLRTEGKALHLTPGVLAVTDEGQPIEKRAIAEFWRITNPERSGAGLERARA